MCQKLATMGGSVWFYTCSILAQASPLSLRAGVARHASVRLQNAKHVGCAPCAQLQDVLTLVRRPGCARLSNKRGSVGPPPAAPLPEPLWRPVSRDPS